MNTIESGILLGQNYEEAQARLAEYGIELVSHREFENRIKTIAIDNAPMVKPLSSRGEYGNLAVTLPGREAVIWTDNSTSNPIAFVAGVDDSAALLDIPFKDRVTNQGAAYSPIIIRTLGQFNNFSRKELDGQEDPFFMITGMADEDVDARQAYRRVLVEMGPKSKPLLLPAESFSGSDNNRMIMRAVGFIPSNLSMTGKREIIVGAEFTPKGVQSYPIGLIEAYKTS